jgi:hypothetical protein
MAALDAEVRLRNVQIAAWHADPRTITIYDRRRENFDRRAAYVVVSVSKWRHFPGCSEAVALGVVGSEVGDSAGG